MERATHPSAAEAFLAAPGTSLDLAALLTALLRGKRIILLMGALCAVLGWLLLTRIPTTYKATVMIMPPQVSRGGSTASLLSQAGLGVDTIALGGLTSVLQSKTQADMFVVILSAWPIEDALVRRFNLGTVYHAKSGAQARRILAGRTAIKGSKDGFITIGVIDTDRKRSAAVANGYVDEARNFMRGLALSEASQRRIFYEAQLGRTKDDLAVAETAFKQMQQSTGMVSLDSQARGLLEGAAALHSQITAKEVQLQSLRGYSTKVNPQVEITQTELDALRGQLARLETRGQGGSTGRSLSSVPGAELDFVRATRELRYEEGLYDLLVKQYEGSRLDEARDAPIIQVIEPALPPETRFGPKRMRDVAGAFGLGLLLGMMMVLFRYWHARLDSTTRARLAALRGAALQWSA